MKESRVIPAGLLRPHTELSFLFSEHRAHEEGEEKTENVLG